jgi:hypothetical protein
MNKIFGCSCGGLLGFRVAQEPGLTDSKLTKVGSDGTEFSAVATTPLSENKSAIIIECISVVLRGIWVFV